MTSKTVGILAVVIIVVLGVWLMMKKSNTDYTSTMAPQAAQPAQVLGGSASATTNTNVATSGTTNDSSDTALTEDAAAISAQMNGLNADTAAAAQ